MRLADFDYDLPEGLIAKQPLAERDASRLLFLPAKGGLEDRRIRDLPDMVRSGDVWVFNDTRVVPARLLGRKASGGKVEILLLGPAKEQHVWRAWGKSNKPLKAGMHLTFAEGFHAEVISWTGKQVRIRLHAADVAAAIAAHGHMPLPPYIDRADTAADRERYQTVYARHAGAVAAPTAGLHFTPGLIEAISDAGAKVCYVTLHVGPGTFQPVTAERIEDHAMHRESYAVPQAAAKTVNAALMEGRRVVAVGTTALRTLEAAFHQDGIRSGRGKTDLFIYPGYRFRVASALVTNFHLPRSTLLMLVCALGGRERVLAAYQHAMACGYRFYSYGDAMLLEAAD